jgi:hypothetical protein
MSEKKPYYAEYVSRGYYFRNGTSKLKELFKIPMDEKIHDVRIDDAGITIITDTVTYDRRKIS